MSDTPEIGTSRGSRYRFLSRIATGGMAELYLGEATGVGGVTKRVALKRILPGHAGDKEYLEMFLEEARLASTLQHPNIVQTYDVIRSGEDYVMVMEFLEGCDLYQFRRRLRGSGQVLQLQHVLYIATGVLAGLHYAHERRRPDGRLLGIVHRDVSPQNIFLTYDGGVKLLDFGIAKADTGLHRTESGVLKGKVLYMSPEQCGGKGIDRRADVYAVGVVMYQLLTGSLPHRGKNAFDTMKAILEQPITRPTMLNPRLHPTLERILMTALTKDPEQRYPTARDMQVDLEKFSSDAGMFASSVGFSTFVEATLGPRRTAADAPTMVVQSRPLPSDIQIPAGEVPATSVDTQAALEQVLFESPQVVLKRIAGIQVLVLSGTIDERFDGSALAGQLKGEVIVDSGDVTRITSFGIRQLIGLFSEAKPRVTGLYHVRCSVAMVSQITMIRSLLGGGRILSFHAPFLDPASGTSFNVVLQGQEALSAIAARQIPRVPAPSDPSRAGEFDDDPEVYFNFAEDFLADPPPHLGPALRALEEQDRRLELELTVADEGSTLFIRRPLREGDRWKRAFQGLEGAIKLDLSEVTATDDSGVRGFVGALESVADELRSVRIVGAPLPLCKALATSTTLRTLVTFDSVQVFGRCKNCATERRLVLTPAEAIGALNQPIGRGCSRCNGAVALTSDVSSLGPWAAPLVTGTLDVPQRPRTADPSLSRVRAANGWNTPGGQGVHPIPNYAAGMQSMSSYGDSRSNGRGWNASGSYGGMSSMPGMQPVHRPEMLPPEPPKSAWTSPVAIQVGCLLSICLFLVLTWLATAAALFVRIAMG